MKFRVRNQHGELAYESFGQVEQAWLMGLVEPSDEILEEGHTTWRRADSYPLLHRARREGDDVWGGKWFLWALIGVIGGTIALVLFREKQWAAGFAVAVVDSVLMIKVTVDAQQRRRPHGRLGPKP